MTFKNPINTFEHMDISKTIYGGVVENSTKN